MNKKTIFVLGVAAAVGLYLWSRSKKPEVKGTVTIRNPDGTTSTAQAWFPQYQITDAAGNVVASGTSSVPNVYQDMNQYGGAFVGPPISPQN